MDTHTVAWSGTKNMDKCYIQRGCNPHYISYHKL